MLIGNGDGTFEPAPAIALLSEPHHLAVADFNSDGVQDVLILNFFGASLFTAFLGNGDGTFQDPIHSDYSFLGSNGMTVADFDGDSLPDLAVAMHGSGLNVLLGNGDGTFRHAATYFGHANSYAATVGDFNADGILDLAASYHNWGGGPTGLHVLLGNGDGSFELGVFYRDDYLVGTTMRASDFNGDGYEDLATTGLGIHGVRVLLGNGDGTFQDSVLYTVERARGDLGLADVNGDGTTDLVLTSHPDGQSVVIVFLGNGDGNFQAPLTFEGVANVGDLVTADFDGDGTIDLALTSFTHAAPSSAFVLLNDGDWGRGPGRPDQPPRPRPTPLPMPVPLPGPIVVVPPPALIIVPPIVVIPPPALIVVPPPVWVGPMPIIVMPPPAVVILPPPGIWMPCRELIEPWWCGGEVTPPDVPVPSLPGWIGEVLLPCRALPALTAPSWGTCYANGWQMDLPTLWVAPVVPMLPSLILPTPLPRLYGDLGWSDSYLPVFRDPAYVFTPIGYG